MCTCTNMFLFPSTYFETQQILHRYILVHHIYTSISLVIRNRCLSVFSHKFVCLKIIR